MEISTQQATKDFLVDVTRIYISVERRHLHIGAATLMILLLYLKPTFCILTVTWSTVMIGLFINVRIVSRRYLDCHIPPHFSGFFAFAVVSAFLGQLVKAYSEIIVAQNVLETLGPPWVCSSAWLRFILGESTCISYYSELSKSLLWELNPFNIAIFTTRDLCLAMGEAVGKVAGRTVAAFIGELPYILLLPVLICLSVCCCTTVLLFFNYSGRFSFLKGLFEFNFSPLKTADKNMVSRDSVSKSPSSENKVEQIGQPQVKLVKECYLRS
ncbi:hypothetical protein QR680_019218 [Steinernema hermaphroditum]|uniref:Uncharacterized protein n=1 Tax=Steinernema hermaphroditum TaxID=289476 RepID=A0AA39HKC5_9BILA|nr:hypothetical protein QR680_019218 [Steinernema hermaphroditum]